MTDEPKVYIVGAGPGDPELITVKGLRILQRAAVILYTDSLVPEELVFQGNPRAEIYKSAGMDLEAQIALMVAKVRAGLTVARVHTGDPAVFGAIMEQVARLSQAGVAVEI
ncbi:MAG: SAM-dependent methyltransferase, partial [Sulfobacillus sp.]|nr:SAM-dependent methyltransferase [Sulfobacillus sp.]